MNLVDKITTEWIEASKNGYVPFPGTVRLRVLNSSGSLIPAGHFCQWATNGLDVQPIPSGSGYARQVAGVAQQDIPAGKYGDICPQGVCAVIGNTIDMTGVGFVVRNTEAQIQDIKPADTDARVYHRMGTILAYGQRNIGAYWAVVYLKG